MQRFQEFAVIPTAPAAARACRPERFDNDLPLGIRHLGQHDRLLPANPVSTTDAVRCNAPYFLFTLFRPHGLVGNLQPSMETLRNWVRQHEREAGLRDGMTSKVRDRLKALERENRELRQA